MYKSYIKGMMYMTSCREWSSLGPETKANIDKASCEWTPIERGCIPLGEIASESVYWLVPCFGYVDIKGRLHKASAHANFRLIMSNDIDVTFKCKACQMAYKKSRNKYLQIRLGDSDLNGQPQLCDAAAQAQHILDNHKENLDGEEVAQLIDIIDRYKAQLSIKTLK